MSPADGNSPDDTREAYKMTIAHVIFNRGLGHSLELCEAIAEECLNAVEAFEMVTENKT